jgi:hypothetical protein
MARPAHFTALSGINHAGDSYCYDGTMDFWISTWP